jgi:cell division protein FtsL
MAKKKSKTKITKGERLLYFWAIFAFILTLSLKIFCGASIGELKMSIEEIKYNIDDQEKKNESLTMKVNELTSFENVKKVVQEMGLAYNNDNIIVVDK